MIEGLDDGEVYALVVEAVEEGAEDRDGAGDARAFGGEGGLSPAGLVWCRAWGVEHEAAEGFHSADNDVVGVGQGEEFVELLLAEVSEGRGGGGELRVGGGGEQQAGEDGHPRVGRDCGGRFRHVMSLSVIGALAE